MSKFFDNSPAKKQRPGQSSNRASGGGTANDEYKTVGEVSPDRLCPISICGQELLERYAHGRPFAHCSHNIKDDPTSCQFSANLFGKDRAGAKGGKGKSKIACITCDVPVEHVLSLGRATSVIDPATGKPGMYVVSLFCVFAAHAAVCWRTP